MQISQETTEKSDFRLRRIIDAADLRWEPGEWFFHEFRHAQLATQLRPDALALARDGDGWSQLVPVGIDDVPIERMSVWSFHFPEGADNSGFIGWLATHIKRATGSGVLVVCGYNSQRGGVFDYWACPIAAEAKVRRLLVDLRKRRARTPADVPCLDGARMRAIETGSGGVVNADTILQLSQFGDTVCGRYEGGAIDVGYLVGRFVSGQLIFRYAQRGRDGSLDAGRSQCQIDILDDGKLRLVEHFTWNSREGSGINVFEEI